MRRTFKIVLPIPPSVNAYLYAKTIRIGNKTVGRLAETQESKAYKFKAIPFIKKQIIEQEWQKPLEGVKIDVKIDYFFARKGQDPNNYLKIIYDSFTEAELWVDDDCAKPQTGMVLIDKYNPRLEITVVTSPQKGCFKDEYDRLEFIEKYENVLPKRSWNSLMKKLDEGRLTENVYYNEEQKLILKTE